MLIWAERVVQVAFKAGRFDLWNWLRYDEPGDIAFCHVCVKAEEEGKLKATPKTWLSYNEGFPIGKMPLSDSVAMSKANATRMLCWSW